MEIINNGLNSLPAQVEENMKNIKKLASYLKEAYKSNVALTTSSTNVLYSDTNIPDDTIQDGWLFDTSGKLFKITGGYGSYAYITFYSDFKGNTGDTGDTGAQGVRGFSFRFLTSGFISGLNDYNITDITPSTDIQVSDLIMDTYGVIGEITNISDSTITINELTTLNISGLLDKGSYITYTQPTPIDLTTYSLSYNDIDNLNVNINPENEDIIIYIDGNGNVKELYKILSHLGDYSSFTLLKIGDVGGGNQLYLHNIYMSYNSTQIYYISCSIITSDNTPFNYSSLGTWLGANLGQNNYTKILNVSGTYKVGANIFNAIGIHADAVNQISVLGVKNSDSSIDYGNVIPSASNFYDTIVTL